MAVADINKAEIVQQNARGANDTGSPEVQVALGLSQGQRSGPLSRADRQTRLT